MRQVNLLQHQTYDHGQMRTGYRWRAGSIGKQLKAEQIGATVYDIVADTEKTFPYHFHHGAEEWLVVVDGTPTLRMPWGERELRVGDIVCFKPGSEGAHQVRGPGTVLIISANRAPDTVEYPDSGKVGTRPPGLVFKAETAVDYWEGELEEGVT
jgi:uncharacterized cupin superfamily protein